MNTTGQPNGGGDAPGKSSPLENKLLISRGLMESGVFSFTPHQQSTFVAITDGDTVLMEAQPKAGERFGRTTSIAIGVLSRIDAKSDRLQALLLSPTTQAAEHMMNTLQTIGKYTGIRIHACLSDALPVGKERRLLAKKKPHVIVGTPGRVLQLLEGDAFGVDQLRSFVLHKSYDKAWEALQEQLAAILGRLPPGGFDFTGGRQLVADGGVTTSVCFPTIQDRLLQPFFVVAMHPHGGFDLAPMSMNPHAPKMTKESQQKFKFTGMCVPPHLESVYMKIQTSGAKSKEDVLKIADQKTLDELWEHMCAAGFVNRDAEPWTSKK